MKEKLETYLAEKLTKKDFDLFHESMNMSKTKLSRLLTGTCVWDTETLQLLIEQLKEKEVLKCQYDALELIKDYDLNLFLSIVENRKLTTWIETLKFTKEDEK